MKAILDPKEMENKREGSTFHNPLVEKNLKFKMITSNGGPH